MNSTFIHDIALVLGVAAVTSVLFRRLKQPSVLGYLAAGLIVGPYTPVPLFADLARVQVMSEFGVILVMFGVGLELRLRTLIKVVPTVGLAGLIQLSALFWVGVSLGSAFGWGTVESLFLGASIAISSTMVVSKVFQESKPQPELKEFVLGILILQDLAAIVLIAVMTAVAQGTGLSGRAIGFTVLRLAAVLVGMVAVGFMFVPGFVRRVVKLRSPETRVVVAVGICFVYALVAEALGYSVALGAFLAGLLVAESGRARDIEHDLQPLKDVFGAVFFVSVGMTVDPRLVWANAGPSALVFAAVVAAQFVAVSVGGVLSGAGLRRSLHAGLALGQIGEFAFIISGVGVAAGVVQPSLQPILVTVAVLTTFTTPLMVRHAPAIVSRVDRLMPPRLQSWLVLYETLFERLRDRSRARGERTPLGHVARALVLDTAGLVVLLVAWRVLGPRGDAYFQRVLGVGHAVAAALTTVLPLTLGLPLVVGVARNAQRLSFVTTRTLFPDTSSPWSAAGARAWKIALATLTVLSLGLPGAALVRPVLPFPVILVGVTLAAVVGLILLWRAAGALETETRSGAGTMLDLLAQAKEALPLGGPDDVDSGFHDPVAAVPPGFPPVVQVSLTAQHRAVGKTLAQLDLRAKTGASVLGVHRAGQEVVVPTGSEALRAGDTLLLAGPHEAVRAAEAVLGEAVLGDASS